MGKRPYFLDGRVKISPQNTVHDSMDFLFGIKDGCADPPATRWPMSKCLLRVDPESFDIQLKLSSTQMVSLKSEMFATVDSFGVGQYGYKTAGQSNTIDVGATFDQACSNLWFAIHHCIGNSPALLKKTVWKATVIEEFIADEEKDGTPIDVFKYLRYKGFLPVASNAALPLHAPLMTVRLRIWVFAEKGVSKENRPKNVLNTSYYGGAPYVAANNTITSGYLNFSDLTAGDYVKRIEKETGMLQIHKGDLANCVLRFTGTPSLYSAAGKGDPSFPNVMYYNIRTMPFGVTAMSKTASGASEVEASAEEIERMKAMGAIIPDPKPPAEPHPSAFDGRPDDEMSEHERETKRIKLEKEDE